MRRRNLAAAAIAVLYSVCAATAAAAEWSAPLEVRLQEDLCLTYQARLDGEFLVIRAAIQPGWHTFAMDNQKRAEEKLAGKQSLGIDRATEFTLSGLEPAGPWYQSPPKDFSHPELRWFSWGFEQEALFAAKVRRKTGAARVGIRGQACTQSLCKNIDVAIVLPPWAGGPSTELDLKKLVPVR
jgi:hypothetical protein